MKKALLLGLIMMAGCAGGKQSGVDRANFDETASPSEDFYRYATGGWQAANPLKPEFARYGSFDVLRENNEHRIKELFAGLSTTPAAGSVEQKIGDLYRLGLDSVRLNDEKLTPLKADLDAIAQSTNLSQLLGQMHRRLGNPFFAPAVYGDLGNSSVNIFYLDQSGLGMGDRDYYLQAEQEAMRTAYRKYIETLFALAGYTDTAAASKAVMDIETRIAEAWLSNIELRDPYKSYNKISVEQLRADYPTFDWDAYFAELKLPKIDSLNLSHPKVVKVAMDVMAGDRAALDYYLAFNVLNAASGAVDDAASDASFEFFGRTMQGRQEQRPRWKRALAVPNNTLSEAVGEMYVAKYFPESSKQRMLTMVANLQTALGKHIEALDWMSTETKAKAQEKLGTFAVKIGYPDKWKDYSSLQIDPALSYWENNCRAYAWHSDDQMARANTPVDRDEWLMSPQTVNAYYNPLTNEICFPAAILQPPFFNAEADDAANYGAIGVVIGHEMTHGFDDQGRQFDKDGNLRDWWSEADTKAFNAKADVLVAQFDSIEVQPGLRANGRFTLGENIADQGGLRVAYTAMKAAKTAAKIDELTADQRFYLAYAQLWAQNIRPEEEARLTKIDPHSLGRWRVDATLRNLDTFHAAFGITSGAMYFSPEQRVIIW